MGRLNGKVALITGGASGIGLATARLFLDEGAELVLTDRDKPGAEAALAEFGSRGKFHLLDVTREDHWIAVTDAVAAEFGRLDVLVNSAGVALLRDIEATALDEWRALMAVKDVNGLTILDKDEHMRPGTTMQSLASLKPSFVELGDKGGFDAVAVQAHPEVEAINHVHHAGNSSGIVDGAAAVLVGNARAGKRADLKPRARIKAFANIGSEPALMLTGPVDVTEKVLKKARMTLADIDLIEVNEAFASVVLRYLQAFDLDIDMVNVNGGAIAMGHPLGATGAMILGTVLDELERRNAATALITLCIGAGMGTATIIERV